jgi:hypothetical protein
MLHTLIILISLLLPIPFAWKYYSSSNEAIQSLKFKGAAAIWGIGVVIIVFALKWITQAIFHDQ